MNALAIIAPIFGIVLIGWAAALAGLLSDKVSDGLSEYVFAVAVPALIIATLTKPGMSGTVAWSYATPTPLEIPGANLIFDALEGSEPTI